MAVLGPRLVKGLHIMLLLAALLLDVCIANCSNGVVPSIAFSKITWLVRMAVFLSLIQTSMVIVEVEEIREDRRLAPEFEF
jgi:hypothetical protein